jgi:hypothetical protein
MKGIMLVCLLLAVMGCGKGQPWDTYRGEECCRDHGGGGVCMKSITILPSGKWGYEDHGHMTCEGRYKAADGNMYNYQCPGECK